MKLAKFVSTALAGLLFGSVVTYGGSASAAHVEGECEDGASWARFETTYSLSDGWNRVSKFWWYTGNPNGLGNKNNVDIQHKRNDRVGRDDVVYHWTSPDSVRRGAGEHFPGSSARTPNDKWAHTRFEFAFDNGGPDDHCHADTSDYA